MKISKICISLLLSQFLIFSQTAYSQTPELEAKKEARLKPIHAKIQSACAKEIKNSKCSNEPGKGLGVCLNKKAASDKKFKISASCVAAMKARSDEMKKFMLENNKNLTPAPQPLPPAPAKK